LRWFPVVLAVLAVGWVAALAAAPLLPPSLAAALYAAGSLICHQIPERSFHLQTFQLPVCARCFGLYAGGAAGSVAFLLTGPRAWFTSPARRFLLTAAAALPTVATFVLEHGFGWPFSNVTRAIAAVPLAGVGALVVASAMTFKTSGLHYGECAPRRPIGHGQPPPPAST
jgi:uncharacterized membrane protein